MAIDTQDKRASAIRMCLPVADGAVLSVGDRMQVTWNYRGIAAAAKGVLELIAAQVYVPGASKAQTYLPGGTAAQVYVPGAKKAQTIPE